MKVLCSRIEYRAEEHGRECNSSFNPVAKYLILSSAREKSQLAARKSASRGFGCVEYRANNFKSLQYKLYNSFIARPGFTSFYFQPQLIYLQMLFVTSSRKGLRRDSKRAYQDRLKFLLKSENL